MATAKDWDEFDFYYQIENLIVNGNFPDSVDGWILPSGATLTWGDGFAIFEQSSNYRSAYQDVKVTTNAEYKFSVDITNGTTSGRAFLSDKVGNQSSVITSTNKSTSFTPQSDSVRVYIGGLDGAGVCMFDNVILKPV